MPMKKYSAMLQKLIPGLVSIFNESINSIILYGSVARGTETSESDVDIAVIVGDFSEKMHDDMIDFIVDLELEYNMVLSVFLIEDDKFRKWADVMPFYRNVKEEGIQLWPAA